MSPTSDDALKQPVDQFVDELAPVLEQVASRVSTVNVATLQRDVVLEAFNLATAFIDVDGLHTDDELLNLLLAFGPRLETVAQCRTLGDLRRSGLVDDKKRFLETPSTFFDLLVGIDADEHPCRCRQLKQHYPSPRLAALVPAAARQRLGSKTISALASPLSCLRQLGSVSARKPSLGL